MSKIDQKSLEELKNKLLSEEERIKKELSSFAKPTGVPGDYKTQFDDIGTGRDENATEVEGYADNLALENNLENQLKEISEALERIKEGTYGACENCNESIGIERLMAYPAAKICIKCNKE